MTTKQDICRYTYQMTGMAAVIGAACLAWALTGSRQATVAAGLFVWTILASAIWLVRYADALRSRQ